MDSRTPNPNPNNPPPSMRVLTRPPASPAPPPDPHPPHPGGVVVVGFISRSPETCSQLINRVLDSNAFGSGRLDTPISADDKEDLGEWFRRRRISYYYEEDKGVVFLQFAATGCPVFGELTGQSSGLGDWEFEELQGMLFMFSVCHIILYIQEGSNFDTQALKKFRVLQAAKNSLVPYVKSKATPPLPCRPNSLSNSAKRTILAGSSPGRSGGLIGRNASAISLMSGLGSHTSLFPGQCTPVLLFVFVDEFPDVADPSSSLEESTDNSSLNPLSSLTSLARPNLPAKGSSPVVMLARPANKSEGGFRKKLQSSLEAQIRFLIKKCRTLTGSESGHTGSRSGAVSGSTPLFSLETSRAVVLLDQGSVQRTESLEFAIDLVEDVLNGKATSEIFLLESHAQSSNKEDIVIIKDFIYRQSDMVRGRGGLASGANGGVGMVAVAAAAAAASAASGKAFAAAPELPTLETWLSSSKVILNGILSAKRGCIDDSELVKRKPNQRNSSPAKVEGVSLKGADPIDVAVSQLESGRGLNAKFSMSWCERALPTAMDVYLKDLPVCYPTSQHEAHLEKALRSFCSMVRGPAVEFFAKKLEDDCTSIWKSGRQQCDAVSLTGKPCIHQRHEVTNGETAGTPLASHSSGYFFLHACACGRSRQLRPDPFDMESANVSFNCFPDCDELLPVVQLPRGSSLGPVQVSSWKLIRIGGASYYEPSKGLLQSGFSAKQRFLLKWTISPQKYRNIKTLPARNLQQDSPDMSGMDSTTVSTEVDIKKNGIMQFQWGNIHNVVENQRELSEKSQTDEKKISFGVGIPNFAMRKPFAEVVAGSSASDSFPPLKQSKQASFGSEKNVKQNKAKNHSEQSSMAADQTLQKSEDNLFSRGISSETTSNGGFTHDPLVHKGSSNMVPVSITSGKTEKMSVLSEPAVVYVGFEHECPRGHRFLLNPDQLNELETLYPLTESSAPSFESSDPSSADSSTSKNNNNDKVNRRAKSMAVTSSSKFRDTDKSKGVLANGDACINGMVKFQGSRKEPNQGSALTWADSHSSENVHVELQTLSLDDGGSAFNMLNRDLPIYMNCPYCRKSKDKKGEGKIKFADAVSQLQRIFLVTPPFPVVLATCPVIRFEAACLPKSVPEKDKMLQFSFGCPVILPPESFLTLRLPFVYGTQLEDGSLCPLKALGSHPERTAWIDKGTAVQVLCKKSGTSEKSQT